MSLRDVHVEIGMDIDHSPLDVLNQQVDDFLRSINSGGFSDLENDLRDVSSAADDVAGDFGDIDSEIQNSGSSMGGFKKALLGIGGVIAGIGLGKGLLDFGKDAVEASASAKAMNAQFDAVFEGIEESSSASLNKIAKDTGMLPNRLKGSYTQMAAFAKTTGVDSVAALALTERATLAAADSAAFYDKSIEEVSDTMQSFLKGNFENDAALGISATETTRNAAANELYGKSFIKLSEAEKQLTLIGMVEEGNKLAGALGQAAVESDSFENQIGNLKQSWADLKVKFGDPILEPVVAGITILATKISEFDPSPIIDGIESTVDIVKEAYEEVMTFADTWSPLIIGIGAGATAFYALTGAMALYNLAVKGLGIVTTFMTTSQWSLNAAMSANPIGVVATAIGLLVAGGVLLYQNWDLVRDKTSQLWDKLGAFQGVANIVLGPLGFIVRAAVDLAANWDSTRSVWDNVWSSIARTAEKSVNEIITSINKMIGIINKIPGVEIPIVPKVDWTAAESAVSKSNISYSEAVAKGSQPKSYAEAVAAGSHATGLGRVPYDGYMAELHKDEAVFTAEQSNAMRSTGMLKGDGVAPSLSLGQSYKPLEGSDSTMNTTNNSSSRMAATVQIIVQGSDKPQETARSVRDELEGWYSDLRAIFPVVMEG